MKKSSCVHVLMFLMMVSLLEGASPPPALSCAGSGLFGKTSPVVELSSETVALLTAAGKDYSHLETVADLGSGGVVAGTVDTSYTVRFGSFPRFWQTAVISVRCKGGPVFEKCLVTRVWPRGKMDAVSTAALVAGDGQLVKTLLFAEKIRQAVERTGRGHFSMDDVRTAKTAMVTALITRNVLTGTLKTDVDSFLDPDGAAEDLELTIPDYETSHAVTVRGYDFAPNEYGIATSQAGVLPGGARRFMANCPLMGGSVETPFHARLRERAAHEHTDVFIDLDTGMSRIVPENTLPEDASWDVCVKHLRDGWPYIRLNHLEGVSGANLGPVDWENLRSFARVKLEHGPAHPGILIIAHGENSPEWNLAVAYAVERIKAVHPEYAHWPMELSYLEDEMIEEDSRNAELDLAGRSISEALARLRAKGVTWVGVIPFMVNNCSGHIEEIRWLMGQSVEALTSEWEGTLATGAGVSPGFGGILSRKDGTLSGEFAIEGFDTDVSEMEGGVSGTVDGNGNITLEGTFEGYSADRTILCEVTLSSMTGKQQTEDSVSGDCTGTWLKKEKQGSSWVEVDSGALSGTWTLDRNETGKPDLSGLEVFLGSAIESHPLMQQIIEARTRELTTGKELDSMGLVLGMHGADLTCCSESWYGMGDAILESVSAVMPFDTTRTAFMSEVADAVSSSVTAHGNGNTALTLHMIAPGSLSRSMPYVIGYPALQPNVHYLYNQKTLLAFASQERLNLAYPPFSRFPSMTAAELTALELDETSDLMVDWLALHSCELVSSYPVGDSWHGEKGPDKMLEMTGNVYVLKTNGGNRVKLRVFAAGNGMVSLEYAGQSVR